MIIKPIGSVELPRKPRRGMDALAFSESVYRSIQQLRDRVFVVHSQPSKTTEIKRLVLKKGTAANKIQVTDGLVNTQTPTLGGTAINTDPAPEFTVSASSTWFYIKVVGTFGAPDAYVITIHTETSATAPVPDISGTGFTSYELIGRVDLSGGVATIVSNREGGDLRVDSFGSANFWWKV